MKVLIGECSRHNDTIEVYEEDGRFSCVVNGRTRQENLTPIEYVRWSMGLADNRKSMGLKLRDIAPNKTVQSVLDKMAEEAVIVPDARVVEMMPCEAEAHAILERVDRDLAAVEQRTERLMHHYSL